MAVNSPLNLSNLADPDSYGLGSNLWNPAWNAYQQYGQQLPGGGTGGTAGQPWAGTAPNPLAPLYAQAAAQAPIAQAPIAQAPIAQSNYNGGNQGTSPITWLNTPTAQAFSSGNQTTMSPAAFASLRDGVGGSTSGYTPGEAASWAQNYGKPPGLSTQQQEFASKYAADPTAAAAALGISPQLAASYQQLGWAPSIWPEYTAALNKLPSNISNNPTYGSRAQNWYLPEAAQKLGYTNSASILPMLAQSGWNGSYDNPQFSPVAGAPANYDYTTLKSLAMGMKPGFINDPVTGQMVGYYPNRGPNTGAGLLGGTDPNPGPRHDGDTLNSTTDNPQTSAYVNNTLGGSNYGGVIQPPPPLESDPWGTLNGMGFDASGFGGAGNPAVPERGFDPSVYSNPNINTQFLRDITDINYGAYAMSGTTEPNMQKWLAENPNAPWVIGPQAQDTNSGPYQPMTEGGAAPQQQAGAPQAGYGNLPGLANTGAQPGYGTAPQSQQSPWQSWGASWGQNNSGWGEDSNKSGQSFGSSPWGKSPWPGVWG